jgi:hypothetical protein
MAPRSNVVIALIFSTYLGVGCAFRCDAKFSLIGGRNIPDSYVNDDFCDCDDRSDEPNTNACALLTKTKSTAQQMFQCRDTKGSVGGLIYHFHVSLFCFFLVCSKVSFSLY